MPGQAPLTQAKHTAYKEEPPPSYLSWRRLGSSPAGACRAASKQLLCILTPLLPMAPLFPWPCSVPNLQLDHPVPGSKPSTWIGSQQFKGPHTTNPSRGSPLREADGAPLVLWAPGT